jgi:flagellar biosynthesis/type III secretory pathway protein FliH
MNVKDLNVINKKLFKNKINQNLITKEMISIKEMMILNHQEEMKVKLHLNPKKVDRFQDQSAPKEKIHLWNQIERKIGFLLQQIIA